MKQFLILILAILTSFCTNNKEKFHQLILEANKNIYENNFEEAEKLLKKCEKIDNKNPLVYYLMGNIATNKNKYNEAIEYYSKAISLKEDYVEAYINRGRVWFYLDKKDKYCSDFLKAEELGATNLSEYTKFCK